MGRLEDRGSVLTATRLNKKVCHPVVPVKINGVTCHALLDTGVTVSYASVYILDRLKLAPNMHKNATNSSYCGSCNQ